MIVTRLDAERPTVVPAEFLDALGLKPGDEVVIDLVGDKIVIAAADDWPDMFVNNFSTFTEWASKEDSAYDKL